MAIALSSGGAVAVSRHSDDGRTSGANSVSKAFAILDVFSGPKAVLGVSELAQAIGVPKSTAHRLLAIMIDCGYVTKIHCRYALTERAFELGNRVGSGFVRSTGLRHRAMPFLSSLFVDTRETIHLATLSGTEVLYVEKLFGHSGALCTTAVGTRRPAYATALGKAMLAFSSDAVLETALRVPLQRFTANTITDERGLMSRLDEVRSTGLAADHGEMQRDMRCIAAPIRNLKSGQAIAAVSICSLTSRNLEAKYGHALLDIARDLSRVAGSEG